MKLIKEFTETIDSYETPILFRMGKSSYGNDQLIDESEEDDLWFHADKLSSAHLVACIGHLILTEEQYQEVVEHGAKLLKINSKKLMDIDNLKIVYTCIKNITQTKVSGLVHIKKENRMII